MVDWSDLSILGHDIKLVAHMTSTCLNKVMHFEIQKQNFAQSLYIEQVPRKKMSLIIQCGLTRIS